MKDVAQRMGKIVLTTTRALQVYSFRLIRVRINAQDRFTFFGSDSKETGAEVRNRLNMPTPVATQDGPRQARANSNAVWLVLLDIMPQRLMS